MIKSGSANHEVTAAIKAISEEYGVLPLQGVLSHKTKKHLIDGNECIINCEKEQQRVDEWEFAPGDIIHLEVYTTTADEDNSMGKEAEMRTTVYKREMDQQYNLKSKHARAFFSVVN